jgi:steroid 5-alpha reductase family enzyme
MTAMFLFVSIPLIEQRALERRPGYRQVIEETSMLIPLPPRRRAGGTSPPAQGIG